MKKIVIILSTLALIVSSCSGQSSTKKQMTVTDTLAFSVENVDSLVSQTFFVQPNLTKPDKALEEKPMSEIFKNSIAHSKGFDKLVNFGEHNFFDGITTAYYDHRPIVLSPDMIWLLISQGFANHILNNAEDLRSMFVKHDGQIDLIVYGENNIFLDDPNSPWEVVFPEFAKKIGNEVGSELVDAISCNFTTSTPTATVASQITLMHAMSAFFNYTYTEGGCGISRITLEGTPEDWERVLQKAKSLKKYKLDWWIKELEPVLSEFVKASKGEVNVEFWRNMCKITQVDGGYGDVPEINGWLVDFFPYDKDGKKLDLKTISNEIELPSEICAVPLTYIDATKEPAERTELELLAGFFGLSQHNDFAVRPEIGWYIRKKETKEWTNEMLGSIRFRVKDFPDELLKISDIRFLDIEFTDSIHIPEAIKEQKIEYLMLNGKISEEDIKRICELLPNTTLVINDKRYNEPQEK